MLSKYISLPIETCYLVSLKYNNNSCAPIQRASKQIWPFLRLSVGSAVPASGVEVEGHVWKYWFRSSFFDMCLLSLGTLLNAGALEKNLALCM